MKVSFSWLEMPAPRGVELRTGPDRAGIGSLERWGVPSDRSWHGVRRPVPKEFMCNTLHPAALFPGASLPDLFESQRDSS